MTTNWAEVGERIARAREASSLAPAHLAARLGMPEDRVRRMEGGDVELDTADLGTISEATGIPLSWFLADAPSPVVQRRREGADRSTARLDLHIDLLARDVLLLHQLGELAPPPHGAFRLHSPPRDLDRAEADAARVRRWLDLTGPFVDIGVRAEQLGVLLFSLRLGEDAPDGAYVSLRDAGLDLGVAVVNGSHDVGRRRFDAAHEIGHHVFGDASSSDWYQGDVPEDERLVNVFAVHLLAPLADLRRRWHELGGARDPRRAAVGLATEFRVSWRALCPQLHRAGLLERAAADAFRREDPTSAEHREFELEPTEELAPPYLPPSFVRAVASSREQGKIARGRADELLRGLPTSIREPDFSTE